MRNRPTRSEAILWSRLRQRKVSGARFRRQRVIESLGYRVVRVSAELVERDVRAAVAIVRAALGR